MSSRCCYPIRAGAGQGAVQGRCRRRCSRSPRKPRWRCRCWSSWRNRCQSVRQSGFRSRRASSCPDRAREGEGPGHARDAPKLAECPLGDQRNIGGLVGGVDFRAGAGGGCSRSCWANPARFRSCSKLPGVVQAAGVGLEDVALGIRQRVRTGVVMARVVIVAPLSAVVIANASVP